MTKVINVTESNNFVTESDNKTYHLRKSSSPRPAAQTGLSNTSHLTAHLICKTSQNGESQAFILESYPSNFTKKSKTKRGRKKGNIVQNGLTRRGRRVIRVVSDCYHDLVTNKEFRESKELGIFDYPTKNNFITLTFRKIIPDDKTAKKLLDNFLKRLRRLKGENIHYLWVAERQKRGAIHFHILTPEYIQKYEAANSEKERIMNRVKECVWINRNWNEVVANWALKSKKITKKEYGQWLGEYKLSESYYTSKMKWKYGIIKTEPQRPRKSNFLLLPNLVSVNNAGNYMAKYISKEDQNIIGGMYDASKKSRSFLEQKTVVKKDFETVYQGNKVIDFFCDRASKSKVYFATGEFPHNGAKFFWLPRGYEYKIREWYFDFLEIKEYEKNTMNKKKLTLFKVDTG